MNAVAEKQEMTSVTLTDVEQFIYREAKLLDDKKFDEWTSLFTEDGTYWIPTEENQADPYTCASIMYDDKLSMASRIRRLNHPNIHSQTPASRTVHMVTNVALDSSAISNDLICADACFTMFEFRDEQQIIYGGRYTYVLVVHDNELKISEKIVRLVNCDAAHNIMSIYI